MFKMCTTDLWDGSGSAEATLTDNWGWGWGWGFNPQSHWCQRWSHLATWGRQEDAFRLSRPQESLSGLTTGRRWGAFIFQCLFLFPGSWSMYYFCEPHCSCYSIVFFLLDWCVCVWEGGVVKCYACLSCNVMLCFLRTPTSQGSILQIHSNMTVGGGVTASSLQQQNLNHKHRVHLQQTPSSLRGVYMASMSLWLPPSTHTLVTSQKLPWSDFMPINSLTIF